MDDRYNPGSSPFSGMPASAATTIRPAIVEPSSPEDDSNIKDDMEMDMVHLLMRDATIVLPNCDRQVLTLLETKGI